MLSFWYKESGILLIQITRSLQFLVATCDSSHIIISTPPQFKYCFISQISWTVRHLQNNIYFFWTNLWKSTNENVIMQYICMRVTEKL